MPSLNLADDSGSLYDINVTQGDYRSQIFALTDLVRQAFGIAAVSSGSGAIVDPLTAPFTLYVNPYIGQDTFAGGSYNTYEAPTGSTDSAIIDAKLKRLDNQRLTCGFTPYRPFKTINRAVIEAAIITSKDWYTITDPKGHLDCVSIILAPGVHTVYNDPGSGTITDWTDSYEPTIAELIKFNPSTGGVLLPRGCSLIGPDLRKTTFRPNWVPTNADEANDLSNRSEIFKSTGTGYFYGFTFMDKIGENRSHHLLSGFGFASEAELDAFYTKVNDHIGTPANLSAALTVTRETEYQIVGPIDDTPDEDWDTTQSASSYIYNCSVRSDYGMGGIHADGSKVEGLKSFVTAQYTGVSLQTDLSCWERYSSNTWSTVPDYATYISTDPKDIRMKPARRSWHIRAINNAFIQAVSVFAIGQGVHHGVASGGEITITNSNSTFGSCAALASGYRRLSFGYDQGWRIAYFKVPLNISDNSIIDKIYLGVAQNYANGQNHLDLREDLTAASGSTSVPKLLADKGYTLREGSYIWVENPNGSDWRVQLAANAWSTSDANRIFLVDSLLDAMGDAPGLLPNSTTNRVIGRRVYIRRLRDTRTLDELKLTVGMFASSAATRFAEEYFILNGDTSAALSLLATDFPDNDPIAVSSVVAATINASDYTGYTVVKGQEVQLKCTNPEPAYANNMFYRKGSTVTYSDKHFTALRDVTTASSGSPSANDWEESYVHMPSDYRGSEKADNQNYRLILDNDTDSAEDSTTLGFNFTTIWTINNPTGLAKSAQDQYRSSNDYRGAFALLRVLGFSETASHAALRPRNESARIRRVNDTTAFPTGPSGGAASTGVRGPWAMAFHRPSNIRFVGHAYEWVGTLNYSKALPGAQRRLTALNKFTAYFTNELGGRVVPEGANEDGFRVRSTGIENPDTGQIRTPTALSTFEQVPVNEFPAGISAGGLSVFNDIIVNGRATFTDAAKLSSANNPLGPVALATLDDLKITAIPASDTAILDGNLPRVVTNKGLLYWKDHRSLLSSTDFSFETGTDANEVPFSGMLGRMAFIDEWCGYSQGGGSVTQATNKSTGVTLNTPCGSITTHNAALAGGTAVAFTLTNDRITEYDVVAVSIKSGATAGAYAVSTLAIAGGSVQIVLRNLTNGSLSEAVVLNFVLIKSTVNGY